MAGGEIKYWNLKKRTCYRTITAHDRWVRGLFWERDRLFSCSNDKTIKGNLKTSLSHPHPHPHFIPPKQHTHITLHTVKRAERPSPPITFSFSCSVEFAHRSVFKCLWRPWQQRAHGTGVLSEQHHDKLFPWPNSEDLGTCSLCTAVLLAALLSLWALSPNIVNLLHVIEQLYQWPLTQ